MNRLERPIRFALADGQELELGQLRLRILHTPGHRPELISMLIVNPVRSPEPSMVLTADSLLVGDVGRPDFGGGDAAAQFESLNRLLRFLIGLRFSLGILRGRAGRGCVAGRVRLLASSGCIIRWPGWAEGNLWGGWDRGCRRGR